MSLSRRVADRYLQALVLPREYHLPKEVRGMPPIVPNGTDIAAWKYEQNGRLFGVAFMGKASQPVWHYRFKDEAGFQKALDELADNRRMSIKRKQDERDERKKYQHDHKVGDIFSTSWGYDQTNVDFYEVTAVKGKMLEVREVAKEMLSSGDRGSDKVVAVAGRFTGPVLRVLSQPGGSAKIEGHYATKWDGKPQYQTAWGYGH